MKTINELNGLNYFSCVACMSVWADALSWANYNHNLVTKNIDEASNIIILSCQVTDLAVLNDLYTAERLKGEHPDKNIFISGCLAQRLDIDFPEGVERLEMMRMTYQPINDKTLVNFEKPFWVKEFKEDGNENENLIRNKYPLRIGKGCSFNCTYCTIKMTRGDHEIYNVVKKIIKEFEDHDDVVLIADSPTAGQIKDWCKLAIELNKPISIRNVEPQIVVNCKKQIESAAKAGVLHVFHCPIQNNNPDALKDMGRNAHATTDTIKFAASLKQYGVVISTNIIIDYKDFPNNFDEIYKIYDYVSWNPYWDGKWDRAKAEERFKKYIKN